MGANRTYNNAVRRVTCPGCGKTSVAVRPDGRLWHHEPGKKGMRFLRGAARAIADGNFDFSRPKQCSWSGKHFEECLPTCEFKCSEKKGAGEFIDGAGI